MSSNERHPAGSDSQDKYEATVLDFLDKEMAAVQPAQEAKQQSNELDALVSDLLKQVITEADQPQAGNKLLFDSEDELFSEMTPDQQKSPFPVEEGAPTLPASAAVAVEPSVPATAASVEKQAEPESDSFQPELLLRKRPVTGNPLLGSVLATKGKLPVKAIACAAALLMVLAGAIYFFSGSAKEAPKNTEPSAAVVQPAEPQPTPVSQTVVATIPETPKSTRPAAQPAAVPPVKTQGKTTKKPATGAAVVESIKAPVQQPAPPKPANTTAPAVEERPIVEPAPTPVQTPAAASERPASKPAQDVASSTLPAVPEKKPDPPKPAEPPAENSTPAPKPAAAVPAARSLTAAVPISQASPVYPELALRTRTSASVVLELQIDDQGKVSKATPVSGPSIFHNAAVAAALKWRYRPASIGGVNVPSQATVTMVFKLNK